MVDVSYLIVCAGVDVDKCDKKNWGTLLVGRKAAEQGTKVLCLDERRIPSR